MMTLKGEWERYTKIVFRDLAETMPRHQYFDLKAAFYAGATITLEKLSEIADENEEKAVQNLNSLHEEMESFTKEIEAELERREKEGEAVRIALPITKN